MLLKTLIIFIKMIVLIDNYDSFTFNVYHYLSEIGSKVAVYRNDKISPEEIIEMKPKGIVISPGPCTPNEAGISLNLINKCENLFPILGICLGHQSIGQAFGSKIVESSEIMHGKIGTIIHNHHNIFDGIFQDSEDERETEDKIMTEAILDDIIYYLFNDKYNPRFNPNIIKLLEILYNKFKHS